MSFFDEALASARDAVAATYGQEMTIHPRSGGVADPDHPSFTAVGVLHEFAVRRFGGTNQESGLSERVPGSRAGRRFDVTTPAAPTRISFDLSAPPPTGLGGAVPSEGTLIDLTDGRRFEMTHSAPPNGGRVVLFVTEVAVVAPTVGQFFV